jgi:heme exporter protein D
MMRSLDFSSWSALLSTLLGLVLITIVMVGIRLMVMQTVQARRERDNRQVNERLKTLIAAYKTLGGSFTGELAVDPTHLRDLQRRAAAPGSEVEGTAGSSERSRRIRDAVEGALSDVILLGTEEQVTLAALAAADLVAGRPTRTDQLVVSLRDFIRKVLDLEAVPHGLEIPQQGPARQVSAAKGKGGADGGERAAGGRGGGGGGGGGAGGTGGAGGDDDAAQQGDHHS